MQTWNDLQEWWRCPRAWAYRQRYEAPYRKQAMLRGSYIHRGAAAHYLGEDSEEAVRAEHRTYTEGLRSIRSTPLERQLAEAEKALDEALPLLRRYIARQDPKEQAILVETTLRHGSIGGTPDRLSILNEAQLLVDIKTGTSPNVEALDHEGQLDYYAWLVRAVHGLEVPLVAFDIVSPEWLYRHVRPPRFERGAYIASTLQTVALLEVQPEAALAAPYYTWECGKCPFLRPCRVRDAGGDDDEVLMENFMPRTGREGEGSEAA